MQDPHGSAENGLNWDDGIIPYNQLQTGLSESVALYANLYSFAKCKFLAELIGRSVLNLEDYGCPTQRKRRPGYSCVLPCHHFNINFANSKRAFLLQVVKVSFSNKILC